MREAIGVFDGVAQLDATINDLQVSGFDRAEISMLATQAAVEESSDTSTTKSANSRTIAMSRSTPTCRAQSSFSARLRLRPDACGNPVYCGHQIYQKAQALLVNNRIAIAI